MPVGLWNVEWLAGNESRAWPFADFATRRDKTGTFFVVNSFLCELYLPISAGLDVESSRFYLRRLSAYGSGYALSFAYDDGSDDPPTVGTAVIPRSGFAPYTPYTIAGQGDFDETVGRVVVGSLADIDAQPGGDFEFTPEGGALDLDCIRPQIRGLSSLVVTSGGVSSGRLYGDIELEAGAGMSIGIVQEGGVTRIRLDASAGLGLTTACDCPEQELGPPIRTLSGISPDDDGNIDLVSANTCLHLESAGIGTLVLSNLCAQPCCGCEELSALWQQLDHLRDESASLNRFVSRVRSSLDGLSFSVLGSRLTDDPCITC
jgi:hypothetical protein